MEIQYQFVGVMDGNSVSVCRGRGWMVIDDQLVGAEGEW